ncbi:hypothetical protein PG990_009138 [Apiospora arundinis]
MAPSFDVILRSRPITFVLGQAKTDFTIHADALTPISKALRVLLDGDMKEAKEACVTWDDVDSETFIRFAQWVYTNDYAPPDPDILLDSSNISIQPTPSNTSSSQPQDNGSSIKDRAESINFQDTTSQCHIGYGSNYRSATCHKCRESYSQKTCGYCGRALTVVCAKCGNGGKSTTMAKDFTTSAAWRVPDHVFKPRLNTEECEDYSKIFLSHANLYILADKYDIAELGKLSMHKLYATLVTFKLYPSRSTDILSLVELVYENTRVDDGLRSMMVHYCACTVEHLAKCEKFQSTLQSYPEFSSALMAKTTERLY